MSEDSDNALQIENARRLLVENYCIIASSTLLWFDAVLTLPSECCWIWGCGISLPTMIYLLTKYLAVIERVFFVLQPMLLNIDNKTCGGITHTDDVLTFLSYLSFSAFTCLRVYMIGRRDWLPFLLIVPLSLVRPIALIVESAYYDPTQWGPPYGCGYYWNISDDLLSNLSIASRAATVGVDSIVIWVTWKKYYWGDFRGLFRTGRRRWFPFTALMLGHGAAHFLVLLIIQVITITSNLVGNSLAIWLVWPYFDQVVTVILLSRLMLGLHKINYEEINEEESAQTQSNIGFMISMSKVLANLDSNGPDPTASTFPYSSDTTSTVSPSHPCSPTSRRAGGDQVSESPRDWIEMSTRPATGIPAGQWGTETA